MLMSSSTFQRSLTSDICPSFPNISCERASIRPRCQVKDLATPFLRGEAELRGEGRDCREPVRRRVNLATFTAGQGVLD